MVQNKDFYSFFFTHLSQEINESISNWVDIDLSTQPLLSEIPDNNLSFIISALQPEGTITYEVENGTTSFYVSSSALISDSRLTVDSYSQPITSYLASIQTPIGITDSTRSYVSPYSSNLITSNFNQSYPLSTTYENKNFIEIPWYAENINFSTITIDTTNVVFSRLSVDSSEIKVDKSHLDYFSNSLLTASRTSYTEPATLLNALEFDLVPIENTTKKVILERNPVGEGILTWTSSGKLLSKTYKPAKNRGYLPSIFIKEDMTYSNLKEMSLGLMGLIASRKDELLLYAIDELIYIWEQTKIDPTVIGLPSNFGRETTTYNKTRILLDQAWIGLTLVKAIKFFRDRPAGLIVPLSNKVELLLKELITLVSLGTDEILGETYLYFDEDGFASENTDQETSYISSLFLHSSLSNLYDQTAHHRAGLLQLNIEKENNNFLSNGFLPEYIPKVISRLMWNICYSNHTFSLDYLNYLLQDLNSLKKDNFYYGLLDYIIPFIPNSDLTTLPTFESLLVQRNIGLYSYQTNRYPDLISSTWMRFKISGYNIFPILEFNTYTDSAELFKVQTYAEADRLTPFGYKWFSEKARSIKSGNYGTLIYSSVQPIFNWYLYSKILQDGVFLASAQAWALDNIGFSLGRERPYLQSDYYFKNTIFFDKNKEEGTLLGLNQTIDALYKDTVDFIEPNILSIKIGNEYFPWVLEPEVLKDVSIDTQITSYVPRYPTSEIIKNGDEKQYLWKEVVPFVNAYTYSYLPNIELEINKNVSSGISTNIYVCRSNIHKINTLAG